MSITTIIMMVIGVIAAIFGGIAGHGMGKSTGRKEGAEQAAHQQEVIQAKAVVEATQERSNVDQKVAITPRADIDRELSEFPRPD